MRLLPTLFLLTCVEATPMTSETSLQRRYLAQKASCNRPIPAALIPGGSRYRTFGDKAQKARKDAKALVQKVSAEYNAFRHSTAYSHYFTTNDDKEVQAMYKSLSSIFSTWPLKIPYYCGTDQSPGFCLRNVLAITSALPKKGYLVLCDYFFSDDGDRARFGQAHDLDSRSTDQWCQAGQDYEYFTVAATTIIHELTHLDVVGAKAKLPLHPISPHQPLNRQAHGTVDVELWAFRDDRAQYRGLRQWQAARRLPRLWDAYYANLNGDEDPYNPLIRPFQNADSYAAAAVEYYFLKLCGWDEILPHDEDAVTQAAVARCP